MNDGDDTDDDRRERAACPRCGRDVLIVAGALAPHPRTLKPNATWRRDPCPGVTEGSAP